MDRPARARQQEGIKGSTLNAVEIEEVISKLAGQPFDAAERIYIGRRFKNDCEWLEKLFDLYTKMTADQKKLPSGKAGSA